MQSNASVNEEFIDLIDEIKPPTGNIHLKYKTPLNSYVRDFLINLPKFNEIKFFINNDIIRLECKIIDYDNDRFRYINYEINDFICKNIHDKFNSNMNRLGGINNVLCKCDNLKELYFYEINNHDRFLNNRLNNDLSILYITYIYNAEFSFLESVRYSLTIKNFCINHLLYFEHITPLNCQKFVIERLELIMSDVSDENLEYITDSFLILIHDVNEVIINDIVGYKSFYNYTIFLRNLRDNCDKLTKESIDSINNFLIY